MIRDCGGKIGIESILGKEIFGSLRICGMVGIWIPFSIIIMTKWRLYRGTFSSSCRKMEEFNWGFGNLGLGKLETQREIGIRLPSKEDTRVAEHEVRVQGPSGQSRLFHGHLSEDAREEGEIVPEGKSLMPLPSQEFQAQLERTQTVGKKVISDTVDAEEGLQMVKGLVEDQSAAANDHIMEWDEIRATFLEHGIDMDAADDLHDVSEMEVEEESMGQEEEKINQVDEMQHVTDGEKGQGVGDAALKQGAKKKQSKLMVTTAAMVFWLAGMRMATRVLPGDLAREARLCNDMDVVSVLGLIKPWTGSAACAEH
ncbi:unnamed protein product [Brassica napus]|uniref:(rape) hypothetical protein n=1 Tax=Brassica napus TaxID=3708 RepID=A0A816UIA0_BRANA|nr:unnamed protein product [Brassica napus]